MFNAKNEAIKIQEQIVTWRRDLHQIPEIGFDLPQTSDYIQKRLDELGVQYEKNVAISGIVATIKGSNDGKVIALRCDMDALAIKEETGLDFAATNGNMHACAHDSHMAIMLGAIKLLNDNNDKINGTIKIIFQPAEEGPGGAELMIKEGVLENPKVDAIMGFHNGQIFKEVGPGQIGICYGRVQACLDKFHIKVKGKGCHGAMPDNGVDPIVIASQVVTALQTIISREFKPTNPGVVTIGKIQGGSAYNAIPDFVEMEGTARALEIEDREKLSSSIEKIVAGISQGMHGDYEYEYTFGYPPTVNDASFTKEFKKSVKKIVAEEDIIEIKAPTMGGEDMAYYLQKVPGTYFYLGGLNEAKGIVHAQHNPKFTIDEDFMWIATALLVQGAIDWLDNN